MAHPFRVSTGPGHLLRGFDHVLSRVPKVRWVSWSTLILFLTRLHRWLCAHDRADEGLRVLAQLHAHGDTSDSYVLAEFEMIQSQIAAEKSRKSVGYLDLFRGWPNLRRTILVMAIQASCQMTGVSAIQYFSPQIFAQIGITTSRSLLFQAVNAIIAFAGTTTCIFTIDRVGRRPLQIFGHLFLCVTFVVNAAIIKVFPTTSTNTSAHWAFVVMTWLFNFGQSATSTLITSD